MLSTEEPRRQHTNGYALHPASASSLNQRHPSARPDSFQHIWIITGPAGCGKTTVAKYLARELALPYIEGDDYHSKSNKDKMAAAVPLTDADRWDWLIVLREEAIKRLEGSYNGVVVTCSALKHKYRDVIRVAAYDHPSVQIHFIYLRADESVLLQRVGARQGHYMKNSMVHSQFESLEEPDAEWDVLSVDVSASPAEVQRTALGVVNAKLAEYQ